MCRKILVALTMCVGATGAVGAVVSCEDPGPGTPGTDQATGVTADFVVDSMRIGKLEEGEGFNLDGEHTPPGGPFPEDGPGGVDNQLGALLSDLREAGLEVDPDAEIATRIANGELIFLLRHVDVDSWTHDPDGVRLLVYVGKDADTDPRNNLTGDAELLADARALTNPNDLMSAQIQFGDGRLHDTAVADGQWQRGDFEAGPAEFRLEIPVRDTVLTLKLHGARLVWDLRTAPTGTPPVGGKLINGVIGGYIFLGDLAEALAQIEVEEAEITPERIRSIVADRADMDVIDEGFTDKECNPATVIEDCSSGQSCRTDPDRGGRNFCYEEPSNPDAISLGLVFTAVSCRITRIWTDPSP